MIIRVKKPNIWQFTILFYLVCILMSVLERWVNYATLILFVLVLFCVVQQKGKIIKRPLAFIWSLWIVIYPILDYLLRGEHTPQLYELLSYGAVFIFLLFADENLKNTKLLITGFKVLAFFELIGVFLQLVFERLYIMIAWRLCGRWSYNMTGFSTDATVAAFIFAVGIGIIFTEFIFEQIRKKKAIKFLQLFLLFIGLIITTKRSMVIAVGVAVLLEYLILSSKSLKKFLRALFLSIILISVAIGLVLIFYYVFDSDNALGRLGETIVGYFNGEDVTNSRSIWAEYMNEWRLDNVWFGIGWESFKNRILQTSYSIPNGHNVYLQIMCEEGYIGLIIFVALLFLSFILAVRNTLYFLKKGNILEKKLSFSSLFIVILFTIYIYFGNGIYDSYIYMVFFAGILIISTLNNKRTIESKKTKDNEIVNLDVVKNRVI